MKVGRNDPCPCGSGKKAKRCCGLAGTFAETIADSPPVPDQAASPAFREETERSLPRKERDNLAPLQRQIKDDDAFSNLLAAIEEAVLALEEHRKEYERLARKPRAFLKRVDRLFAEKPFEDMRFTAEDLQKAFEQVGYPAASATEAEVEHMERVVQVLVDKDRRLELASRLLSLLPEYVEAERHLDALLIEHSAMITGEPDGHEVGPFLVCMYLYGLQAWEEQRFNEEVSMLEQLGVGPEDIRRAGFEGINALISDIFEDEEKKAAAEKLLEDHPTLKAMAQAQCEDKEDAAIALLEREDARDLLLTPDELAPFIPQFMKRLQEQDELLARARSDEELDPKTSQAVNDLILSAAGEVAESIFTPERLARLSDQLLAYRKGLRKGDRRGHAGVQGALMAARSADRPGERHVLVMLCWTSLLTIMEEVEAVSD